MLIHSNNHLIPKFANFFQQFSRRICESFPNDFLYAFQAMQKRIKDFPFNLSIDRFRTELCLVGFGDIEIFLSASLLNLITDFIFRDDESLMKLQAEINFLLKVCKLSDRAKRLKLKSYEESMNHVKNLYNKAIRDSTDFDSNLFDIKSMEAEMSKINPQFENMITQVLNKQVEIDMNFILRNPQIHAKYLFIKALENPEKVQTFAKIIQKLSQHPLHKVIKPMIVALCEEIFEIENNVPNEGENIFGASTLLKLIAELFNVGVIEPKSIVNVISTLSENNSVYSIYAFAILTKEKVEKNKDPEFKVFKEFLIDVTRQWIEDIEAVKK